MHVLYTVSVSALSDSFQLLVALGMVMAICMVVFSAAITQYEPGACGSTSPPNICGSDFGSSLGDPVGWYLSVTRSFWWSLVTLTGVGYGDEYPMKATGRIIAVVAAALGVLFVAVPIEVISRFFTAHFSRHMYAGKMQELCEKASGEVDVPQLYRVLTSLAAKGLLKVPCPESEQEVSDLVALYDGKGIQILESETWTLLLSDIVTDRGDFANSYVRKIVRELQRVRGELKHAHAEFDALVQERRYKFSRLAALAKLQRQQ